MRDAVVVLLDALGTKGLWQRVDPAEYIRRWEHLRADALAAVKLNADIGQSLNADGRMNIIMDWKMWLFSDTIICVGSCNERDELTPEENYWLLYFSSGIAQRLIGGGLEGDIRLRGAISSGKIATGEEIVIGPAIDEAAAWYERSSWIGAHLCPTAARLITAHFDANSWATRFDDWSTWALWKVPMNSGPLEQTFAVGWPLTYDFKNWAVDRAFSPASRAEFISRISDMESASGSLAEKFRNTVAFTTLSGTGTITQRKYLAKGY